MELLVVENEAPCTLAGFERGFAQAGLTWRVVRAWAGDEVPASMGGSPGLVVLGGAPHVYDPATGPWMEDVMRLVRHAHAGRVPVLGVCLGAQLVAQALGGRVLRGPAPEEGFAPLRLTEAGRGDPVVGHLEGAEVLHLHDDTYVRPPGAALLASSARYEEQAFRLGATTYGLQFHPEATPALVERLVPESDGMRREAKAREAALDRVADGVAAGFAGLVRQKLRR
ncbi:MAG TPA: type 1 glutamine amidotransferase [Candidatus Thermoplasmatota archaeon]|nr:type 1 glutamine amidotransferase [Candidatus Thermoplasmatota archaeon]